MKKPLFQKVAILGLGLIGGSIALDLKKRKLAGLVAGYNRSPSGRRIALKRKACDKVFSRPQDAAKGADLVILAVPVGVIPELARRVAPAISPKTLITDVGSTKAKVVRELDKIFFRRGIFIGSHPIAGTEHSGMESALPGLFAGRWWIFTPTRRDPAYRRGGKKLIRMAKALGAKVAMVAPREHDLILAAISHLPHAAAYSLVNAVKDFRGGKSLRYAAGGLRDFTRIAASSPQMWTDIFMDNSQALLTAIDRFERSLFRLRALIRQRDRKKIFQFFETARQVKKSL